MLAVYFSIRNILTVHLDILERLSENPRSHVTHSSYPIHNLHQVKQSNQFEELKRIYEGFI